MKIPTKPPKDETRSGPQKECPTLGESSTQHNINTIQIPSQASRQKDFAVLFSRRAIVGSRVFTKSNDDFIEDRKFYVNSLFCLLPFESRLQRSLQYFTSSHTFSHFLRQVKGRPHTTQSFEGKLAFLTPFKETVTETARNFKPTAGFESILMLGKLLRQLPKFTGVANKCAVARP